MNSKFYIETSDRNETNCPEPLNEFSDMYKHKRMPCKSALNFGENANNSYVSNFIPEYPTTYYSNPEIINQGINSLVEPKQLHTYSSPVGDLERTIEHRIGHETNWNNNNILTPTHSGSLEMLLFDRRDSPIITDTLKNYTSFERLNSGNINTNKRNTNVIFPVGQRLERLSSNEINNNFNTFVEIDNNDIPPVDIEQYTHINYFEKFLNINNDQIK